MSNYYHRWPVYRSSVGESIRLYDVLPPRLTLERDPGFYWHLIQHYVGPPRTMFKEVAIVPPEETWSPAVKELASAKIQQEKVSLNEFADIYFEAMRKAIARAWEPDKFHFIFHSAGYDTRIMSMALWSLYQERGDDWLGDILFVEWANEAKQAKRVIKAIGWDESLFVVYNEGAPPDEYHARSLNFKTAWKRTDGGMRAYPFNMWWDVPEWAQERGLIPSDDQVQCWSAFYANNVVEAAATNTIGAAFSWMPYEALAAAPLKGTWVFPFADLEFIRTIIKCAHGQNGVSATPLAGKALFPMLAQIENPSDVRYRGLSDRLYKKAISDYLGSVYGRIRPHVGSSREIDYCQWWGHWGLASLCEELLVAGWEIDV